MKKSILFVLVSFFLFVNAFAFTVVDDEGRVLEFDKPFGKIISLYGAHTENIFHLGAGNLLIGVSTSEAFPAEVHQYEQYSYKDDAEKFIAANPDLIVIRPFITTKYGALIEKLEKSGIKVVSFQPENKDEMEKYLKKLGVILGKEEEAENMINDLNSSLSEFEIRISQIPESERKTVYFESVHKSFRTATPYSLAAFVLKNAGAVNVADDAVPISEGSTIADYPKEKLLEKGDIIDVYIAQEGAMNKISKSIIFNESGYGAIKAVREGKIYIVDEKIISRPTWRLLTGIEEIARILYPEIFDKIDTTEKSLSKMAYVMIMVKYNGVQFFTPGYDVETINVNGKVHTYGDYEDLDYEKIFATYAETAVFNKMIVTGSDKEFRPGDLIDYGTLKEYLKCYYSDKSDEIAKIFDGINSDDIPSEVEFLNLLKSIGKK